MEGACLRVNWLNLEGTGGKFNYLLFNSFLSLQKMLIGRMRKFFFIHPHLLCSTAAELQ